MPIATPYSPSGGGTSSNPHTLPGTAIAETSTTMAAFSVRVHRQSAVQGIVAELWYWREAAWHLSPAQPLMEKGRGITLHRAYRRPATIDFELADNAGLLTPENLDSPYNKDSSNAYDPLMDEARKILVRLGVRCYDNLAAGVAPTASSAATSGTLSKLTNGTFADWTGASSERVLWTVGSAAPITLTQDLGAAKWIRHAAARFGTKTGTITLPASVQIQYSTNGTTWSSLPARPLGGTNGDWEEDEAGRAVEAIFCDIEALARYVRFVITPTGSQTFGLDEIAVFGGDAGAIYGQNVFVGYLGDSLDFETEGIVGISATDVFKKCSDNNGTRLTAPYKLAELSQIARSLLTSNAYWKGQSEYSTAFSNSEIGWGSSDKLTELVFPLWQSQSNNIMGYVYDLFHSVGWDIFADGNGVVQAYEPPYKQRLPERVFICDKDGNNDCRKNRRHRTGKDLRNEVSISSGKIKTGGSSDLLWEPNSVKRYGPRRNGITDPIASTPDIQRQIARYLLRDYAWRLQTLTNFISPDFDTHVRGIYGFRAPKRPHLFAKAGTNRVQELWSLMSIEHKITAGKWEASAEYVPYKAQAVEPPQFISLTPGSGGANTQMTLAWNTVSDPKVVQLNVYRATTSSGPYTLVASGGPTPAYTTLGGHTVGQRYWYYITAVDDRGFESIPSNILTAVAGGVATTDSGWTVTDLDVALITIDGPDAEGYYTYQFQLTWTSPPGTAVSHPDLGGFKRMRIMVNPLSQPAPTGDPSGELWSSWAWYSDEWEWHGDYIAPGLMWDRATPGQLDWTLSFRSTTNFTATQRLYFRMWTSSATTRWRRWGGDSLPGWPSNVTYYEF